MKANFLHFLSEISCVWFYIRKELENLASILRQLGCIEVSEDGLPLPDQSSREEKEA